MVDNQELDFKNTNPSPQIPNAKWRSSSNLHLLFWIKDLFKTRLHELSKKINWFLQESLYHPYNRGRKVVHSNQLLA